MVETIAATPFTRGTDSCLAVPTAQGLGTEIDRGRLKELEQSGYTAPAWTWEEDGRFDANPSRGPGAVRSRAL